jgi:hypothetical protein
LAGEGIVLIKQFIASTQEKRFAFAFYVSHPQAPLNSFFLQSRHWDTENISRPYAICYSAIDLLDVPVFYWQNLGGLPYF